MEILTRQENKNDRQAVHELIALAFAQENEAKLVDLLRNSAAFVPELSIVATVADRIVGHILFTKIAIVNSNQRVFQSLALAPVAVIPGYQQKGIGSQLIKAGIQKATTLGFTSAIVLGHKDYYPQFGFEPADNWQIKAPFEVPANVFMAIELVPDGLKNVSGMVKYPKEFDIV